MYTCLSYRKWIILVIPIFFFLPVVHAQDPNAGDNSMQFNKTASPSGNSNNALNSMNAGASLSTELYTGRLQASLPLYVLQGSDLKIPISLEYNAGGGVRTSDLNTVVGIGWSLNAGGSISRTVRGLPDESANGYIGTNNYGLQVVNDFNNPANGLALSFNNTYNSQVSGTANVDGEPDIFIITTPSFSARFTIDEHGVPVFQHNSGLTVAHQLYKNTANASSTGITVTDDQGNQYIFGTQPSARETTTTKFFGQSFTFVSTWYLEKIVLYNTKDVVNFTYMLGQSDTVYYYQQSKDYTSTFASSPGFPPAAAPISYSSVNVRPVAISTVIFNDPRYISQIITKQGEADFTYTYNSNVYINSSNPPELTGITIKQYNADLNANTNVLKTYTLSYTELETGISGWTTPFPYNSIYSEYYRRLLNNITVAGNTPATASPLSLFGLKYYQSLPYPERGLPQNCDYWGYPNNTAFLPDGSTADAYYFTNPDDARMPTFYNPSGSTQEVPTSVMFGLNEIDNVTGGASLINYEQNTYYDGNSNVPFGGARVSSIVRTLPTGESLSTNYVYNDASGHSTGQVWSDLYKRVRLYFGTSCCNFQTLAFSQSPYGIGDDNGIMLGYSAVSVVNANGGYETDNFTNFSDYPDNIVAPSLFATTSYSAAYNTYVSAMISSFSYKRGLLKSRTLYNANGNPVSQTTNTYASLDAQPVIKEIGIQDMTWWLSQGSGYGTSTGIGSLNIYNSNIENWRLKQSVQTNYDQIHPANSIQTTTAYAYCADERLIKSVTTTDSKGLTSSKTFYHPNDGSIPMSTTAEQTVLANMVSANCINMPVHETDNRNGAIHQVHSSYTTVASGSNTNVYLSTTTYYTGSTQVKQELFNYDPVSSNLISSSELNGKPTSFLYGYNGSLPLVQAVNALSNEIFYEGFEQNSSDLLCSIGPAHTGSFYYAGNYTVNFSLPDSKSYIIQWWNYSGGVWNFNEQPYTGSITLTGPVDDIRIFPSDALINSYTYLPMVGKTSQINEAGRSENYEYDGLGRPSITRDQNKNVLRKICYNYSGQSENCTTTYYNVQLSRPFTRNNCGSAVPSTVIYTVPVGRYTSPLSQSDADQQAQNDMNANGQAYANSNGTCTIPITLVNNCSANTIIVVSFSNAGGTYNGSFNPVPGSTATLTLPGVASSYTVTLTVRAGTALLFNLNGVIQVGSTVTFTNVGVGSAQTITACNAFYNIVQSGTYTKAGCTAPQIGSQVTYTVPANTYVACSQAAANQLAVNDVTNNGQAYANSHGVCYSPGLTLVNNTTAGLGGTCAVQIKSGTTVVSSTTFPTSGSTTISTIPAGTYSIELTIVRGTSSRKFTIGSTSLTGTDVTFTNITLSSSVNVTITATTN